MPCPFLTSRPTLTSSLIQIKTYMRFSFNGVDKAINLGTAFWLWVRRGLCYIFEPRAVIRSVPKHLYAG